MRICAGGRRTRPSDWETHRRNVLPLLEEATTYASSLGLELAIENHADLLAAELAELITTIDDPALGVCLDTANNLRMLEDVDRAIEILAPFAKAVHLKDVQAYRGDPKTFAFWPSVPVGRGLIDVPRTLRVLNATGFDGLLAVEIDYLHPAFDGEDDAVAESLACTRVTLAALSS
jgi:3-oxoisoapionate decarboxylase